MILCFFIFYLFTS